MAVLVWVMAVLDLAGIITHGAIITSTVDSEDLGEVTMVLVVTGATIMDMDILMVTDIATHTVMGMVMVMVMVMEVTIVSIETELMMKELDVKLLTTVAAEVVLEEQETLRA